jgi:hypothetical protein
MAEKPRAFFVPFEALKSSFSEQEARAKALIFPS